VQFDRKWFDRGEEIGESSSVTVSPSGLRNFWGNFGENESWRVAMERDAQRRERERRAGAGFSPRVKEIIGDTGPRPSLRRPYEIAILSNPPCVLPASGKCPHISMPTVMDIVERRWVVPAPQLVSNYRNWDRTRVRGWVGKKGRGEERLVGVVPRAVSAAINFSPNRFNPRKWRGRTVWLNYPTRHTIA